MSSTRSSETPRPWYFHPVGIVLNALLTGLISVSGFTVAATEPDNRAVALPVALFMGSVSVMMLLSLGRLRDPWSVVELDARPAWRLRLGGSRRSAAGVALVILVLGAALAYAAVTTFVGRPPVDPGGDIALAVFLGLLAAFLVLVGESMTRVVLRAPALYISTAGLRHTGAGVLVELDWDDVGTIEWAHLGTRWAAIRIGALRDAASHRVRRRATILTLDKVPDEPGIELRLGLVADPPRLLALLREMQIGGQSTRESLISRGPPEASGR